MESNSTTVEFKANHEDVTGARPVFLEYGITLEEGMDLFLRHVAEMKSLPEFIGEK